MISDSEASNQHCFQRRLPSFLQTSIFHVSSHWAEKMQLIYYMTVYCMSGILVCTKENAWGPGRFWICNSLNGMASKYLPFCFFWLLYPLSVGCWTNPMIPAVLESLNIAEYWIANLKHQGPSGGGLGFLKKSKL